MFGLNYGKMLRKDFGITYVEQNMLYMHVCGPKHFPSNGEKIRKPGPSGKIF